MSLFPRPSRPSRVAAVEMLEGRRLLSATLGDNGVLKVVGDAGVDNVITVALNRSGDVVATVNGTSHTFALDDIEALVVKGRDGDDSITVDDADDLDVAAYLVGGRGNDTIVGGSGPTVLNGGRGDDSLTARGYFNVLLGGSGDDRLIGSDERDLMYGGAGRDTLRGNGGDDLVLGGSGKDDLDGGRGRNFVR